MSDLVSRVLAAAHPPIIRPRVVSMFEPAQELEASPQPWSEMPDSGRSASADVPDTAAPVEQAVPVPAAWPVQARPVAARSTDERPTGSPGPATPSDPPAADHSPRRPEPVRSDARASTSAAQVAGDPPPMTRTAPPADDQLETPVRPEPTPAQPPTAIATTLARRSPRPAEQQSGLPVAQPPVAIPSVAAVARPVTRAPRSVDSTPDEVRITIGRVEVHSSPLAPDPAPASQRKPDAGRLPALSLDDYLKQRSGGVSA